MGVHDRMGPKERLSSRLDELPTGVPNAVIVVLQVLPKLDFYEVEYVIQFLAHLSPGSLVRLAFRSGHGRTPRSKLGPALVFVTHAGLK